jgi:hypothetical protein
MAAGAPPDDSGYTLCLPEASDVRESIKIYQTDLIRWLRAHPELRESPTDDVMIEAIKALYKCKDRRVSW